MKVLITGSKGMLGQYIADVFFDCDLVCLDRKELDITKENEVNSKIKQIKPDVIINCAAYNNVDKAESEPDLANLINGYAVGFLAKAAKNANTLLVHYSTNYVFNGEPPQLPLSAGELQMDGYSEKDTPNPQSAYGKSKLLGEQEAQKYNDKYYIIRTSRLFGKQGSTGDAKKTFVDMIIEAAQKSNNKIKAIDEEYDLPTYGFDLARKTREIIDPPLIMGAGGVNSLPYGIYHIVNSGEPCTWYGFAREIFDNKDMDVKIEPVDGDAFGKRPAKRLKYSALNNTKLKPLRDWREALREYLSI